MVTYVISQATGQQSRWIITHLLKAGANVHAIVRDPTKTLPSVLYEPGVKIFKGESVNFDEVFAAAQGCQGAYLNTVPIPGLETQMAQTFIDACKKAGVENIVASSTFTVGYKDIWDNEATKAAGLHGYFVSKQEVENKVRNGGFKNWTILRPGFIHYDYFLQNSPGNFPGLATKGELDHVMADGMGMPQIDANDIGRYGSAALLDPARFNGKEIEMINESLTPIQLAAILSKVSGKKVTQRRMTEEESQATLNEIFGRRFHYMVNFTDFTAVIEDSKRAQAEFGMPYTSLEDALQRDRPRLIECLDAAGI